MKAWLVSVYIVEAQKQVSDNYLIRTTPISLSSACIHTYSMFQLFAHCRHASAGTCGKDDRLMTRESKCDENAASFNMLRKKVVRRLFESKREKLTEEKRQLRRREAAYNLLYSIGSVVRVE